MTIACICDKCGRKTDMIEDSECGIRIPDGWQAITIYHLCPECYEKADKMIDEFMKTDG